MKKFLIYLLRWQLSTPIIWLVVRQLGTGIVSTIIANLIGGVIFFWVDKFIFKSSAFEVWHIKNGKCNKCQQEGELYRLVRAKNYNKVSSEPIFLCSKCSKEKLKELKLRGVKINITNLH